MKTLVHYDHLLKTIIVQHLDEEEEPEIYLRVAPNAVLEVANGDPDPYWHVVEGKWKVATPTCIPVEEL